MIKLELTKAEFSILKDAIDAIHIALDAVSLDEALYTENVDEEAWESLVKKIR